MNDTGFFHWAPGIPSSEVLKNRIWISFKTIYMMDVKMDEMGAPLCEPRIIPISNGNIIILNKM